MTYRGVDRQGKRLEDIIQAQDRRLFDVERRVRSLVGGGGNGGGGDHPDTDHEDAFHPLGGAVTRALKATRLSVYTDLDDLNYGEWSHSLWSDGVTGFSQFSLGHSLDGTGYTITIPLRLITEFGAPSKHWIHAAARITGSGSLPPTVGSITADPIHPLPEADATVQTLASEPPTFYRNGISLTRNIDPAQGWPLDGTVLTVKYGYSDHTFQLLLPGQASAGQPPQYRAGLTDTTWTGWTTLGGAAHADTDHDDRFSQLDHTHQDGVAVTALPATISIPATVETVTVTGRLFSSGTEQTIPDVLAARFNGVTTNYARVLETVSNSSAFARDFISNANYARLGPVPKNTNSVMTLVAIIDAAVSSWQSTGAAVRTATVYQQDRITGGFQAPQRLTSLELYVPTPAGTPSSIDLTVSFRHRP
jgi:hypothetical protein